MLAVLMVRPWQMPLFESTVYEKWPKWFLFSAAESHHAEEMQKSSIHTELQHTAAFNLKTQSVRLLLCVTLSPACHCHCWYCVPFQMSLTQFSNDTFHRLSYFQDAPKRENYTAPIFMQNFLQLKISSSQAEDVGGNVGGKSQDPSALH